MNLFQARQALIDLLGTRGDFRPGSPTYDASVLAVAALQVAEDASVEGKTLRVSGMNPKVVNDGLHWFCDAERVAILNAAHRALFNA